MTVTEVSIEDEIRALRDNGWKMVSSTVWQSPAGPLFRGPHGAYEQMVAHSELNRFASRTAFLASLSHAEHKAYIRATEARKKLRDEQAEEAIVARAVNATNE